MGQLAIALPFRNAQEFIGEAIESILSQTHRDFTLLAVNDSSTDDSAQIVADFDDPRVEILHSPSRGISAALNTAMTRHPVPEFVARHDADDRSHPERFTQQLAYLRAHQDVTVLASNAHVIDREGSIIGRTHTPVEHTAIIAAMRATNPICHGSVMMRTEAVLAAGGYSDEYPVAQGYEMWVRLARRGARFASLTQLLYEYRAYEQSWSRSQRPLRDSLMNQIAAAARDL